MPTSKGTIVPAETLHQWLVESRRSFRHESSLPGKLGTAEGQTEKEKHKARGEENKTDKVQLFELTQSRLALLENVLIDLGLVNMGM